MSDWQSVLSVSACLFVCLFCVTCPTICDLSAQPALSTWQYPHLFSLNSQAHLVITCTSPSQHAHAALISAPSQIVSLSTQFVDSANILTCGHSVCLLLPVIFFCSTIFHHIWLSPHCSTSQNKPNCKHTSSFSTLDYHIRSEAEKNLHFLNS